MADGDVLQIVSGEFANVPVATAVATPIATHAGAADPHTGYQLESGLAAAITATKIDDFTAGDDNTDLNASATKHGLLPKLPNDAAKFLDGTGAYTTPAGGSLTDHTHAATGAGANGGGPTLNPTGLQLPTAAGIALTATEGYVGDDSTTKLIQAYDSQRQRAVASVGWVPYAFPLSYDALSTISTSTTLAAAGGTVACPVLVPGHMLLQALKYRQGDASLLRTMEWQLYVQHLNNADAAENTLAAVTGATGTDSLTAGAASTRTSAVTSPPIYLAPGLYWCVVRNTHATNTFAIQGPGAGTMQNNMMQTKTLASALGSTLDFVAATWTKVGSTPLALILQGRVFGQAAAF